MKRRAVTNPDLQKAFFSQIPVAVSQSRRLQTHPHITDYEFVDVRIRLIETMTLFHTRTSHI
jgi:hypothetical protein